MMNDILCVFPIEETTRFLNPVFEEIAKQGADVFHYDTVNSDEDLQEILTNKISASGIIVFLCHGCGTCLYGTQDETGFNGNELINRNDFQMLNGKKTIIFSCNSNGLQKNYSLSETITFGLIPSTIYEVKNAKFHKLPINELEENEVGVIQDSLVRIWERTLSTTSLLDFRSFFKAFRFNIDFEITEVLIGKRSLPHYRTIADILFYIKKDMKYTD